MPAKIVLPAHLLAERRRVGERIRHLREERKLSQEALAEAAGLDRQTISRIETGTRGPALDVYLLLADALGVPTGRLFDGARPPEERP